MFAFVAAEEQVRNSPCLPGKEARGAADTDASWWAGRFCG